MPGSARLRHSAEFMKAMYPAFSRRATQVCILSSALEKIALGAADAQAIARAALDEANPFGWKERAAMATTARHNPRRVNVTELTRREAGIVFIPTARKPARNEPWAQCAALLLNPCDGFHLVYANFDGDGEFIEFNDWAGQMYKSPYTDDFYVAWALLPDEIPLIEHFDPKRRRASAGNGRTDTTSPNLNESEALRIVKEQAEDEGLWIRPANIVEDYLQQELRRLHRAVEGASSLSPPQGMPND